MKTMLEKWLLFFGVLLFCLFVIPELKASAGENYIYISKADVYGYEDMTVSHVVNGNVHAFHVDGFETLYITLEEGQNLCVFNCSITLASVEDDVQFRGLRIFIGESIHIGATYSSGLGRYHLDSYDLSSEILYLFNNNTVGFVQMEHVGAPYFDELYCSNDSLSFDFLESCILYSTCDLYYGSTLVFQRPLPTPTPSPQQRFLTAVEMTNLEAVMNQVVGLTPLLIGLLTTLFGFSKGLALLFQTLRQA